MSATAARWLRLNLFARPFDSLLSLLVIPLCVWTACEFANWVLMIAQWSVVRDGLRVLMVGTLPVEEVWRAWAVAVILSLVVGLTVGTVLTASTGRLGTFLMGGIAAVGALGTWDVMGALWVLGCTVAFATAWLAASVHPRVRDRVASAWLIGLVTAVGVLLPAGMGNWGGLLLDVLLTIISTILIIPLGFLLAFGRRSKIASLSVCCTAYIELMRAVPLILIVYLVWIILPLLVPFAISDVLRGVLGFVAFYSAYAAEFIRSGLQSVSRGQTEAAQSLGMSKVQINYWIVLPQALRIVVPALVGNVLDIFNYAPLIFIIGLTDFLRAGQMVLANPQFSNRTYEVYSFLFLTYFAVGSLITLLARRLETHLAKGAG